MSAHSDFLGLKGVARWFMMKHQEETQHAMKVYKYVLDQGAQINFLPVEQLPSTFDNLLSMFEDTLAHEQGVTQQFNELIDVAVAEKDHATHNQLQGLFIRKDKNQ
ncbi:MAG: ferritin, partial [Candidatus Parabeggiatoa sp. nov. 1]